MFEVLQEYRRADVVTAPSQSSLATPRLVNYEGDLPDDVVRAAKADETHRVRVFVEVAPDLLDAREPEQVSVDLFVELTRSGEGWTAAAPPLALVARDASFLDRST